MTDPQPRLDLERRHPHISHEQLRRHLIDADEDRYRLRHELASAVAAPNRGESSWSKLRRRFAIGAGVVIVTGLTGGLVWQMCPPALRANDGSAVRVETVTVTPRIVGREAADASPVALKTAAKSKVNRRAKPISARLTETRGKAGRGSRSVPRPLSPGEFGRPRVAF